MPAQGRLCRGICIPSSRLHRPQQERQDGFIVHRATRGQAGLGASALRASFSATPGDHLSLAIHVWKCGEKGPTPGGTASQPVSPCSTFFNDSANPSGLMPG